MKAFLTLAFLFFAVNLSAQTITQAEILKEFPNIFKTEVAEYEDLEYSYSIIDSLPKDNILAGLTNDNMLYLDYIKTNCFITDHKKLDTILRSLKADPLARNSYYVQQLLGNEVFKKYFLEMSYYYLQSKGITISDYSPQPKLRLTTNELMDIASKFFYASHIENGGVAWYVCVGHNGFKEEKKESMLPIAEAFAFASVFQNDEEQFRSDFSEMSQKLTTDTKTITDEKERLEILRTKMLAEMAKNENLKTVLKREYEKKKSMLNFELTD